MGGGDECLSRLHFTKDKQGGRDKDRQRNYFWLLGDQWESYLPPTTPATIFSNFTIIVPFFSKLLADCNIHRVLYSLSEITKL